MSLKDSNAVQNFYQVIFGLQAVVYTTKQKLKIILLT